MSLLGRLSGFPNRRVCLADPLLQLLLVNRRVAPLLFERAPQSVHFELHIALLRDLD